MIAYLKAFGAKHNLETNVDEAGNVLIKKPATPGKENFQTVILQSHIDMVCEKNNDVQHDFLTDPIETEIDGEWLKAKDFSFIFGVEVQQNITAHETFFQLESSP